MYFTSTESPLSTDCGGSYMGGYVGVTYGGVVWEVVHGVVWGYKTTCIWGVVWEGRGGHVRIGRASTT